MEGSADPDPRTMPIIGTDASGLTFTLSWDTIAQWQLYSARMCIDDAIGIGACAILLITMIMLTGKDKRRSPIFIFNTLSLLLHLASSILFTLYFTGPLYHPYALFTGDYSRTPRSALNVSAATSVLTWLTHVTIAASLLLQTKVVLVVAAKRERVMLMVGAVCFVVLFVGFNFALNVAQIVTSYRLEPSTAFAWMSTASQAIMTVAIIYFCSIFVAKLAIAIRRRHRLGINNFGPMQIILIMSCQTLIIPGKYSNPFNYHLT
jgi:pheromone alpha factor receptor